MKYSRMILGFSAAVMLLATASLLAGCSTQTSLSSKEAASVKGNGPIPPEARARIAEKMAESQHRMQQGMPQGAQGQPALK